jgi:poly-gamma-glutamate capsule biosynthesis protein CapA/YwtB (metallophosphatase superfamily)
MRMLRFSLQDASRADAEWLRVMLAREGKELGTRAELDHDGEIMIRW